MGERYNIKGDGVGMGAADAPPELKFAISGFGDFEALTRSHQNHVTFNGRLVFLREILSLTDRVPVGDKISLKKTSPFTSRQTEKTHKKYAET